MEPVSRYLIDVESIRRVRLTVLALTLVGVAGALVVLEPALGFAFLAVLLLALAADLWRQGLDVAGELRGNLSRLDTAEELLAKARSEVESATAQRDASRAQLRGPSTLESALAIVSEMQAVATSVRSARLESSDGTTRRPIVRFVLDGEVTVTVAGPARTPSEQVSLVGPAGVCVEGMRLQADGPSRCVGECLLSDLEELADELKLAGVASPPGYYVQIPGAVSRTFDGIEDQDVEDLEATLTALHQSLETAIRNRKYDDR